MRKIGIVLAVVIFTVSGKLKEERSAVKAAEVRVKCARLEDYDFLHRVESTKENKKKNLNLLQKEKEKEKERKRRLAKLRIAKRKRRRWASIGRKRITYYCPSCNSPRGTHRSAMGVRLREGHVAFNGARLGSKIKIGKRIYTVVDRCGTNAVDIFKDTMDCHCHSSSYENVQVMVR